MKFFLLFAFTSIFHSTHAQKKQITVSVHRNLEVVNAIAIPLYPEMLQDSLADPWMYRNTGLMRTAYAYFKPYYHHAAVEQARGLIRKIGTGIYLLPLYYEDFPAVKRKTEIPEIIWSEIHANKDSALEKIDLFMQAAARFYTFSRFTGFQQKYKAVYEQALKETEKNLPGPEFITMLEAYYGAQKGGYHIVVMPFFKSQWGMGWELDGPKGKEIYNIAAPFNEQKLQSGKVLAAGYDNRNEVANLSVHEFGHSFVNPLTMTGAYAEEINAYDSLFVPIKSDPQYSNWLTVFNEYVVRAGEIIIMKNMGRHEFAAATKSKYKDWVYLDHFIAQMQIYLNNRKQYASFEQFLPVLIQSLATINKPSVSTVEQ